MTGTEPANTTAQVVVGGVDSHADTIHVAVVTDRGGHIDDAQFPTCLFLNWWEAGSSRRSH